MKSILQNKFLLLAIVYLIVVLVGLFATAVFLWLPPGFSIAGHDSGLPLNAKNFLLTRLLAWDDRLGFGLDNSANFGSLTIHFFDWFFAFLAGTPYAGNYLSLFFWLGLIFVSSFIFAYQLKNILGKPFVFILPVFLTFNFYIFQSVFMLERAKFGIFSATLLLLAIYFRMLDRKISVLASSILVALVFSVFNGGGWFGITLYGGVALVLSVIVFTSFIRGFDSNFVEFKKTMQFIGLSLFFFIFLNAYSIIAYSPNFLSNDVPRLAQESSAEGHVDWLRYVSRSSSLTNLFRLYGVPDWYGEPNELIQVNRSHPYAAIYLNNNFLVAISFLIPILAFSSFIFAKEKKQKQILAFFGLIALTQVIFAAGSNSPFGYLYESLMNTVPGFFLFRSAFYKFGVFYMLGILTLFSFSLSFLIEKLTDKLPKISNGWVKNTYFFILIFMAIGLWLGYHFVLFDPDKIFAWKSDQSTKMQIPGYIYDFDLFVKENNFGDKRILIIPPVNPDWENDAYNWGYWSLSPLPFALTEGRTLSNWHGLTSDELKLVDKLYNDIRVKDEKSFSEYAISLNIGYILLREDVLTDSSWSASEKPENYKNILESFNSVSPLSSFGYWKLYKINSEVPMQIYAISSVNLTSDNFISLVNKFFITDHTVGLSDRKKYPEIDNIISNKVYAFDCLSCLLEKQVRLKSLPDTVVLPGSILYRFKEARERRVLSQFKDTRSRIADYLGFILTRSADLKKMLDFSVKEERIVNDILVIRSYLNEMNAQIRSSEENFGDFELTSQVIDFLNPVERVVSDYLKTNVSKSHSHRFEEEMLGLLWDINLVKENFTPLLDDRERWAREKVYKINFPEPGEYSLSFSTESFPETFDGKVILPKEIKFNKNSVDLRLDLIEEKEGWLSANLGYQDTGDGDLVLKFDELPNLFSIEQSEIEKFPFGNVGCFNGAIKNFDRKKAYEILISKTDRVKRMNVILRDKDKLYSETNGFLKGEDLFEVPTVTSGEFSRYVYFPTSYAKNIFVYVCGDDKTVPLVDKIIVRDFFSPSVLVVKTAHLNPYLPPSVTYKRRNPTSYEGEIKISGNPFLLVFNEKVNPLWKLSVSRENGSWETVDKHIAIDAHTNGWIIEKGGERKFKIEYLPQKLFFIGEAISLISLIIMILILATKFLKKIK